MARRFSGGSTRTARRQTRTRPAEPPGGDLGDPGKPSGDPFVTEPNLGMGPDLLPPPGGGADDPSRKRIIEDPPPPPPPPPPDDDPFVPPDDDDLGDPGKPFEPPPPSPPPLPEEPPIDLGRPPKLPRPTRRIGAQGDIAVSQAAFEGEARFRVTPNAIQIVEFGLLDTSKLSADVPPIRGRVCYDLVVSDRGRARALSKRPGYITALSTVSVAVETIDNAAAVDKGGGLVGIPITGHALAVDQQVTLAGTANGSYDGDEIIVSQTANEIVITATYVVEASVGGTATPVDIPNEGIEAITQDWFEEDGTLQITAQCSDNILYRVNLSGTTQYWRHLENTRPNAYAFGGGRFRNVDGIIRITGDSASVVRRPVWYGYIKRDFMNDIITDTNGKNGVMLSKDDRYVNYALLDPPTIGTGSAEVSAGKITYRSTVEKGLVNALVPGVYEYRVFYQYDGFQYSLPAGSNVAMHRLPDLDANDDKALYLGISIPITFYDVASINSRISGIGLIRRHIQTDGEPQPWYVVGFADIKDGEKYVLLTGNSEYHTTNNFIDLNESTVSNPEHANDTPQADHFNGLFIKMTKSDGTIVSSLITDNYSTEVWQLVLEQQGAEPADATAYDYEIYNQWRSDTSTDDATHVFYDNFQESLQEWTDFAGFAYDLDSTHANYRDRAVVNERVFVSGVMLDPDGAAEVHDDTVFYLPITGEGNFVQDAIDPGKFLRFGKGDGDNVVRIMAHGVGSETAGSVSAEALVILKQTRVYIVDASDPVLINWRVLKEFHGIGCVGRDAALRVGPVIYFMDRRALYMIRGLDIVPVRSFERLDGYLRDFTDAQLRNVVLGFVGTKQWLKLSFPTRTTDPKIFFYDLLANEWGPFRPTTKMRMMTVGHGDSAILPSGTVDLNQKMIFSENEGLYLYPSGTTDAGTGFAAQWISNNIGADNPFMQHLISGISAAHYITGADGTLKINNESGSELASVTLTKNAAPGDHPDMSAAPVLGKRADSFEIQYDAGAAATRADLDAVLVRSQMVKKIL